MSQPYSSTPITTPRVKAARQHKANYKIGFWLSEALEDPKVCAEMKADIKEWFDAHLPGLVIPDEPQTDWNYTGTGPLGPSTKD